MKLKLKHQPTFDLIFYILAALLFIGFGIRFICELNTVCISLGIVFIVIGIFLGTKNILEDEK